MNEKKKGTDQHDVSGIAHSRKIDSFIFITRPGGTNEGKWSTLDRNCPWGWVPSMHGEGTKHALSCAPSRR